MKPGILTTLFCLLVIPVTAGATQWQSLQEIRSLAETYALSNFAVGSSRTVEAGLLDNRLHLKNCTGSIVAFLPPGTRPGPNMTVGVRCKGATPWKVFVPVRSRMTGPVLVSRHALSRGHKIGPDDVELVEHDLDRLPYGYLRHPADLAGRILRRPIAPGAVITPPMLTQGKTVAKGQSVTLFTDQAGIQIQMAGKALSDAALQQRIRVENLSSGRIVEGIVRSAERVEILMN